MLTIAIHMLYECKIDLSVLPDTCYKKYAFYIHCSKFCVTENRNTAVISNMVLAYEFYRVLCHVTSSDVKLLLLRQTFR